MKASQEYETMLFWIKKFDTDEKQKLKAMWAQLDENLEVNKLQMERKHDNSWQQLWEKRREGKRLTLEAREHWLQER